MAHASSGACGRGMMEGVRIEGSWPGGQKNYLFFRLSSSIGRDGAQPERVFAGLFEVTVSPVAASVAARASAALLLARRALADRAALGVRHAVLGRVARRGGRVLGGARAILVVVGARGARGRGL